MFISYSMDFVSNVIKDLYIKKFGGENGFGNLQNKKFRVNAPLFDIYAKEICTKNYYFHIYQIMKFSNKYSILNKNYKVFGALLY